VIHVHNETSPEPKSRASSTPPRAVPDTNAASRHFRDTWSRRLWLSCGCTESCRCEHKDNPTTLRVDGYLAAVEHLHKAGLPAALLEAEARQLWKRGGSDRAVADRVARRWTA
jgi:hypothetical protein